MVFELTGYKFWLCQYLDLNNRRNRQPKESSLGLWFPIHGDTNTNSRIIFLIISFLAWRTSTIK